MASLSKGGEVFDQHAPEAFGTTPRKLLFVTPTRKDIRSANEVDTIIERLVCLSDDPFDSRDSPSDRPMPIFTPESAAQDLRAFL